MWVSPLGLASCDPKGDEEQDLTQRAAEGRRAENVRQSAGQRSERLVAARVVEPGQSFMPKADQAGKNGTHPWQASAALCGPLRYILLPGALSTHTKAGSP